MLQSHAMTFQWTAGLMSAYYPILLTGASILVCFWAEVFHLSNLTFEKPGFLSKSIVGFVAFNLVTYSVLATELVLMHSTDNSPRFIFKSVYALLMLVVLVFFLFYGVEVFFKVRGAFRLSGDQPGLNFSQLQQSRLGLVSQALILLLTTGFILSDVLGSRWKDKVPVLSRNTHHVLFRVAELGAALWFPCVLWNCFRWDPPVRMDYILAYFKPEQLWILNPKKLLKRLEQPSGGEAAEEETDKLKPQSEQPAESLASTDSSLECWICYDMERTDAGPLIQPCQCKGDMSAVHHDCLKTWLIEPSSTKAGKGPRCKVCNQRYQVTSQQGAAVWKLGSQHWCQTASTLTVMTGALGGACLVVRMWDSVGLRTLAVGAALLIQYIGLNLTFHFQVCQSPVVGLMPVHVVQAMIIMLSGVDQAPTGVFELHSQVAVQALSFGLGKTRPTQDFPPPPPFGPCALSSQYSLNLPTNQGSLRHEVDKRNLAKAGGWYYCVHLGISWCIQQGRF
ncbi:hypothetical protein LAZ67_11003522 [Cordylochernes scorpioides]|uniref:RING-CH-type domain-containing protein n=1 Tax=Cordylochernes scorpioides TaxID=51811 RepID=A0ABY6L3D2_9ARAC|nr:hypothetical protein LAZ67_11003522 [Cordylochernes scorpioides]